jgi:hypothetical protein
VVKVVKVVEVVHATVSEAGLVRAILCISSERREREMK